MSELNNPIFTRMLKYCEQQDTQNTGGINRPEFDRILKYKFGVGVESRVVRQLLEEATFDEVTDYHQFIRDLEHKHEAV